jgi:uncharacterized protein YbjT (DUF2867 family)
MKHRKIIVFGGSGFVGGHLAARLVAMGRRVTIVARRREKAARLFLLPTVNVEQADPYDRAQLERLLDGHDAAINLIGVLHSDRGVPYGRGFARAHVEFVRTLVAACRAAGVHRLLHLSALGAASDAPSMYLRSKADGETIALGQKGLETTVFRPSVMFGPDDRFLNQFASLQRYLPIIPLASAQSRFAPVSVGDVVGAMTEALEQRATIGKIYELTGPKVYTLARLVRLAGEASGHARPIIALPGFVGRLQAFCLECLPGPTLLSRDNLDSMKTDNVASGRLPGLDAPELLGAKEYQPVHLEQAAADELSPAHMRSHLDLFRSQAHR